jgi:hypothetical protein
MKFEAYIFKNAVIDGCQFKDGKYETEDKVEIEKLSNSPLVYKVEEKTKLVGVTDTGVQVSITQKKKK